MMCITPSIFLALNMCDEVPDFVFEQMFMHTFGDWKFSGKMRLWTFLELVGNKSEDCSDFKILLVDKLMDFDLDFVVNTLADSRLVLRRLFLMNFECFKVLARRNPKAVRAALEKGIVFDDLFRPVSVFMQKMQYLLSTNDYYFNCVVNFFESINTCVICYYGLSELETTSLVLFMVEYGMRLTHTCMCDIIYTIFGDCVLFRTLLHLDIQPDTNIYRKIPFENVMASFISDIRLDVETVAEMILEKSCMSKLEILSLGSTKTSL
mgnify:FL=1